MDTSPNREQWCADLEHDIALIHQAKLRSRTVTNRLRDALHSRSSLRWYAFTAPAPGISQHLVELGEHFITLEFQNYEPARLLWEQLTALKDDFKVIAKVDVRKTNAQEGILCIGFPVHAKPEDA